MYLPGLKARTDLPGRHGRRWWAVPALVAWLALFLAGPMACTPVPTTEEVILQSVVRVSGRGGSGTGIIVTPQGHIATSLHTLGEDDEVTVLLADGRQLPGMALGRDEVHGITVVKIAAADLTPAILSSVSDFNLGESVLVVGWLEGEPAPTVTRDIIAWTRRVDDLTYVETYLPLDPQYRGGPVANLKGEVIGIHLGQGTAEPGAGGSGSYALSATDARPLIFRLISGESITEQPGAPAAETEAPSGGQTPADGAGTAPTTPPPEEGPAIDIRIETPELVVAEEPATGTPRAYLSISLVAPEPLGLTILDPLGQPTGPAQRITEGSHSVQLPLTPAALGTPMAGRYTLHVERWQGETVAELAIAEFEGARPVLESIIYPRRGDRLPETALVTVGNEGDLPFFITRATVGLAGQSYEPPVLAQVPPGETLSLELRWQPGPPPDGASTVAAELWLFDSTGQRLLGQANNIGLARLRTYATGDWALTYPEDWLVEETGSDQGVVVILRHPSGPARVEVSRYWLPGQDFNQWVNDRITQRRTGWVSFHLDSDEVLTGGTGAGRWLRWTGRPDIGSGVVRVVERCLAEGPARYGVTAIVPESDYPVYAAEMELMLQSFAALP